MFNSVFIIICIALLALVSCQQQDPTTPDSNPKKEEKIIQNIPPKPLTNQDRIKSIDLANNLKINVRGADPEKYVVQFSWPYLEDEKILRVRLATVLGEIFPSQTFFTYIISHNQAANFSFDVLDKNRKVEFSFTKTVQIPTDFIVRSDNFELTKNQKIEVNRLYLSKDFPLTIRDHTVDIVTNELHAEYGMIQTFPEKVKIKNLSTGTEEIKVPTAASLQNGRSGGNLSITAKKIFGRLKVFMRGEVGGRGPQGDPILNAQSGEGFPAGNGSVLCDEIDDCAIHPQRCLPSQPRVWSFRSNECYCKNYGPPGGIGVKGNKGNKGKPGMTGGDTGNIRVSVEEYVPVDGIDSNPAVDNDEPILVEQFPGDGGEGGPGGEGQKGSPGGKGRDSKQKDDCRGAPGPQGAQGDNGEAGVLGKKGNTGLKCIIIGSKSISQCT
ncbi:MAG: collagen-like triple helix repeat-containing protein [Pseudobdellovibrionaceae bacterium]